MSSYNDNNNDADNDSDNNDNNGCAKFQKNLSSGF